MIKFITAPLHILNFLTVYLINVSDLVKRLYVLKESNWLNTKFTFSCNSSE